MLTVKEFSKKHGIDCQKVRAMLRNGDVCGIKKGRMWFINDIAAEEPEKPEESIVIETDSNIEDQYYGREILGDDGFERLYALSKIELLNLFIDTNKALEPQEKYVSYLAQKKENKNIERYLKISKDREERIKKRNTEEIKKVIRVACQTGLIKSSKQIQAETERKKRQERLDAIREEWARKRAYFSNMNWTMFSCSCALLLVWAIGFFGG